MRKLFAILLVLGGVLFMTASNSSAARFGSDTRDLGIPTTSRTLVRHASAPSSEGIAQKAKCSSDSGDSCSCGKGKLCVSGDSGCACIPAN